MKVNHLNLTVTDVEATVDFLERYFGLQRMGGNKGMAFMLDENGTVLTLMRARQDVEVRYPGFFHIGFMQESE